MIKELRDLSGIGQVERRGIYKQSLCKSTIHYFQVGDYMQKINYCIQDLNGEIPGLQQLTNKNVVYVVTLVTWIREAVRGIRSLYKDEALKGFVFSREDELAQANSYLSAVRSFIVAHPLQTNQHSNYGMDGTLTCIDIKRPGEYLSIVPEKSIAHLDYAGLHENTKGSADFYLYAFSTKTEHKDVSMYIGCSLEDIYHAAELYIDKLYALNKHLQKQKGCKSKKSV